MIYSNVEKNTATSGPYTSVGLYTEIKKPSLSSDGFSMGSVSAGVCNLSGDHGAVNWNFNTMTASANAAIRKDYVGYDASASLFSGSIGVTIPATNVYVGVNAYAGGISTSPNVSYSNGLVTYNVAQAYGFGLSVSYGIVK